MRLPVLLFALFSFFSVALAWTKEDYEIFDLVGAVEAAEGKGTTFYSWLDISPKATNSEISKAYRKKSMILHPDKNPGVKGIQERFARLGVVAAILRDPEGRTRYDFFFKNGVPKWRGTGYYYSRFRPGLGSVAVFLAILTSLLQFVVQRMNHKKDLERIDRFVSKARAAAWGPRMIPQAGSKKVRVSLSNSGPEDESRSVEMLVEGGNVYLLGDDEPVLLDASVATRPSLLNTWVISLIRSLFSKVIPQSKPKDKEGPVTEKAGEAEVSGSGEEETDAAEATDGGASSSSIRKGVMAGSAKTAGRRRKVNPVKKR